MHAAPHPSAPHPSAPPPVLQSSAFDENTVRPRGPLLAVLVQIATTKGSVRLFFLGTGLSRFRQVERAPSGHALLALPRPFRSFLMSNTSSPFSDAQPKVQPSGGSPQKEKVRLGLRRRSQSWLRRRWHRARGNFFS
jgi:hypothetical protein